MNTKITQYFYFFKTNKLVGHNKKNNIILSYCVIGFTFKDITGNLLYNTSLKNQRKYSYVLYIYSKCSTCQNALKFLKLRNVSFVRKEIVEIPPSVEELRRMLDYMGGNLKKIFNSSGQFYREMQLTEKLKSMSEEDAILLLNQHGMLVKRPFLLGDDFGFLGFKEIEWPRKM
jgi:arsenate reductase (glutaredoxin)